MSVLVFLILASLTLAVAALLGFVWAVKSGQFEDTCTPSMRVLIEEPGENQRSFEAPSRESVAETRHKFAALSRDAATQIE